MAQCIGAQPTAVMGVRWRAALHTAQTYPCIVGRMIMAENSYTQKPNTTLRDICVTHVAKCDQNFCLLLHRSAKY